MSTENAKTLEVYDKFAEKFLQGCAERARSRDPAEQVKKQKWQEDFLSRGFASLPKNAKILEVGSGDCQNAIFLRDAGYRITPSDVAPAFLDNQAEHKFTPTKFNLLTDELVSPAIDTQSATQTTKIHQNPDTVLPQKFNGILAWHVLIHFTPDDLDLALSKIYHMLTPGGRFVCDIQNLDDKTDEYSITSASARWTDYGGAYHLGADRFFQYWAEPDFRARLETAGFTIIDFAKAGGPSGQRWLCFVAEKPLGVKPEIVGYIDSEIIPRYTQAIGHKADHIRSVIFRSLQFAEYLNDLAGEKMINPSMCYVTAAFHDLGCLVDRKTHEKIGADMLRQDAKLKDFFSPEQIEIMAEAVEDHRASSDHEPRSVYGQIVSTADRDCSTKHTVKKAIRTYQELHPEWSDAEVIENAREHLRDKYGGTSGYAAKRFYFPDPDFSHFLDEIAKITTTPEIFADFATKTLKKS